MYCSNFQICYKSPWIEISWMVDIVTWANFVIGYRVSFSIFLTHPVIKSLNFVKIESTLYIGLIPNFRPILLPYLEEKQPHLLLGLWTSFFGQPWTSHGRVGYYEIFSFQIARARLWSSQLVPSWIDFDNFLTCPLYLPLCHLICVLWGFPGDISKETVKVTATALKKHLCHFELNTNELWQHREIDTLFPLICWITLEVSWFHPTFIFSRFIISLIEFRG